MPVVRCPREKTETLRRELMDAGEVDTSRSFVDDGEFCLIPVLGTPSIDLAPHGGRYETRGTAPRRKLHLTPYEEVLSRLNLPRDALGAIPRRWELVGDVLILRFPGLLEDHEGEVAVAFADVLGAKTVAVDEGGPTGAYREPRLRKVWGDGTETTHLENGVRYRLDAGRIMFSSGNIHERIRMASVCQEGEVVVDMFAGVGHLSLPMAVHADPAKVYACEVNPVAHHYLVENAFLNGVEDIVVPLLGDCLDTAPENVADRVVLGYLSAEHEHLVKAFDALRGDGVLHYHEACPNELRDIRPEERLRRAAAAVGAAIVSTQLYVVKSYAPGVSHVVVDAEISR